MRGFKNFKGSDASGPSMYSYSMLVITKKKRREKKAILRHWLFQSSVKSSQKIPKTNIYVHSDHVSQSKRK